MDSKAETCFGPGSSSSPCSNRLAQTIGHGGPACSVLGPRRPDSAQSNASSSAGRSPHAAVWAIGLAGASARRASSRRRPCIRQRPWLAPVLPPGPGPSPGGGRRRLPWPPSPALLVTLLGSEPASTRLASIGPARTGRAGPVAADAGYGQDRLPALPSARLPMTQLDATPFLHQAPGHAVAANTDGSLST